MAFVDKTDWKMKKTRPATKDEAETTLDAHLSAPVRKIAQRRNAARKA